MLNFWLSKLGGGGESLVWFWGIKNDRGIVERAGGGEGTDDGCTVVFCTFYPYTYTYTFLYPYMYTYPYNAYVSVYSLYNLMLTIEHAKFLTLEAWGGGESLVFFFFFFEISTLFKCKKGLKP